MLNYFENYLQEKKIKFQLVSLEKKWDDLRISWCYLIEDTMPVGIFNKKYIITKELIVCNRLVDSYYYYYYLNKKYIATREKKKIINKRI